MAKRRSKPKSIFTPKTMRSISGLLFAAVAILVAVGINQMRHWNILTGWKLIAWALLPLAALLGITLPVGCKVVRTNGLACGHWAYGLLFGCGRVPHHRWRKFRARLQFPEREVKPIGRAQPQSSYALPYQPKPQSQQEKTKVDDGILGVCGFWVSVVSMIASVIPVVVYFAH